MQTTKKLPPKLVDYGRKGEIRDTAHSVEPLPGKLNIRKCAFAGSVINSRRKQPHTWYVPLISFRHNPSNQCVTLTPTSPCTHLLRLIPSSVNDPNQHIYPSLSQSPPPGDRLISRGKYLQSSGARLLSPYIPQSFHFSVVTLLRGFLSRLMAAIKRTRTRSAAARQVSNAHERHLVTHQNV